MPSSGKVVNVGFERAIENLKKLKQIATWRKMDKNKWWSGLKGVFGLPQRTLRWILNAILYDCLCPVATVHSHVSGHVSAIIPKFHLKMAFQAQMFEHSFFTTASCIHRADKACIRHTVKLLFLVTSKPHFHSLQLLIVYVNWQLNNENLQYNNFIIYAIWLFFFSILLIKGV